MYDLELTASQLNWLGVGKLAIRASGEILPHWEEISVVTHDYWQCKYGDHVLGQAGSAAALTAVIGAKNGLPKLDSTNGVIIQGFGSAGVTLGTVTTVTGGATITNVTAVYDIVNSGTYGNNALLAAINTILADTNELQIDWTNGGRLDVILDAAGGAANPLLSEVPGSYENGSAGQVLGDMVASVGAALTTSHGSGSWSGGGVKTPKE
jgi:hypothetical protein